jgi:hypothetical protein
MIPYSNHALPGPNRKGCALNDAGCVVGCAGCGTDFFAFRTFFILAA